jgi:hypothetical protein
MPETMRPALAPRQHVGANAALLSGLGPERASRLEAACTAS